jgi:hypothetical protein
VSSWWILCVNKSTLTACLRNRDHLTFWSGEPQLIKSQNFFVNEIRAQASGDLIANFDPAVGGVWWLSPTKSLAYYDSDSVYLFDFSSGDFRVVFHPTFEGIEIRIGSGGRWALFMRGGSRIFEFSE